MTNIGGDLPQYVYGPQGDLKEIASNQEKLKYESEGYEARQLTFTNSNGEVKSYTVYVRAVDEQQAGQTMDPLITFNEYMVHLLVQHQPSLAQHDFRLDQPKKTYSKSLLIMYL
jgi:hypothetical protein